MPRAKAEDEDEGAKGQRFLLPFSNALTPRSFSCYTRDSAPSSSPLLISMIAPFANKAGRRLP